MIHRIARQNLCGIFQLRENHKQYANALFSLRTTPDGINILIILSPMCANETKVHAAARRYIANLYAFHFQDNRLPHLFRPNSSAAPDRIKRLCFISLSIAGIKSSAKQQHRQSRRLGLEELPVFMRL